MRRINLPILLFLYLCVFFLQTDYNFFTNNIRHRLSFFGELNELGKIINPKGGIVRTLKHTPRNIIIDLINISWKGKIGYDSLYEHKESLKYCKRGARSGEIDRFSGYIAVFKDVYISTCYTISDGNKMYAYWNNTNQDCHYVCGWGWNVTKQFDEVVACGHRAAYVFGHYFFDFLVPIMLLPEDVLYRAKFVHRGRGNYTTETLQMLGIRLDQIVYFPEDVWIFGHIVYSLVPAPHVNFFGKPLKDLSKKLKKAVNVNDTVQPTGFYVMNRKGDRSFTEETVTEIINFLKLNYKEYTWQIYNDDIQTVRDLIILWNNVKFAFAPTGSNLMGIIFIQKDSVVICALCDLRDFAFAKSALTFGARFLMFLNPNSSHFFQKYMNLDMNVSKEVIRIGMYAVKYNKWPAKIF